jgi:hypothetical protein
LETLDQIAETLSFVDQLAEVLNMSRAALIEEYVATLSYRWMRRRLSVIAMAYQLLDYFLPTSALVSFKLLVLNSETFPFDKYHPRILLSGPTTLMDWP